MITATIDFDDKYALIVLIDLIALNDPIIQVVEIQLLIRR